ncbi:MAG: hypothetical protein ACRDQY_14505 [Pseudonocardiaceae bacterium]
MPSWSGRHTITGDGRSTSPRASVGVLPAAACAATASRQRDSRSMVHTSAFGRFPAGSFTSDATFTVTSPWRIASDSAERSVARTRCRVASPPWTSASISATCSTRSASSR